MTIRFFFFLPLIVETKHFSVCERTIVPSSVCLRSGMGGAFGWEGEEDTVEKSNGTEQITGIPTNALEKGLASFLLKHWDVLSLQPGDPDCSFHASREAWTHPAPAQSSLPSCTRVRFLCLGNYEEQPSVHLIKELFYQPEKMQGKITERSFSQGTHLKTLGKLTKKLEIAYEGNMLSRCHWVF